VQHRSELRVHAVKIDSAKLRLRYETWRDRLCCGLGLYWLWYSSIPVHVLPKLYLPGVGFVGLLLD